MNVGFVGRKLGMTRVFTATGESIPVTVVEALPNIVTKIQTKEGDGYTGIQVTVGSKKLSRLSKAEAGHFAKAGVEPGRGLWEFHVDESKISEYELGHEITVETFTVGEMVDVTGTSKGKGFAGTVKRWNFATQDATHGNSRSHRVPGSTGQNQSPRRVFKGKKMCGQLGNVKKTIQSLEVIRVDGPRQLLLIKGAVPGAPGGTVIVKAAVKVNKDAVAAA